VTLTLERPDPLVPAIIDDVTRREFIIGGTATAALLAAGCGSDSPAAETHQSTPSGWSFTDAIGRTVTLDHTPKRIVVLSDLLAATLWSQGLRTIVGAPLYDPDAQMFQPAGLTASDQGTMIAIGGADGPDTERVAKAAPELIITNSDSLENTPATAFPALANLAPWIAFNAQSARFEDIMDAGARLLHALEVEETDLSAKSAYDEQATLLQAAMAAKPGLRFGVVFDASAEGLSMMSATMYPCTLTLGALGAELLQTSGSNPYFEQFSWENVADLPVDFIINTVGDPGTPNTDELPWSQPTWQQMPAVRTGQYLNSGEDWFIYNYGTFTKLLSELTTAVDNATAPT
jgi:iron complex transport system substrate-binding protein